MWAAFLGMVAELVFGTAQTPELLVYEGKTNSMYSTPLESYFSTNNPCPAVWEKVQEQMLNSGCWRCYVGTWEIRDKTLWLIDLNFYKSGMVRVVEGGKTNTYYSPVPLLLPHKDLPLKADWFTGVLRLPQGELVRYVHVGFGSVHEKDFYITVQNGRVTNERVVDNRGSGSTRSTSDLQWVALAGEPVKDDGKWYDGRLLRTEMFSAIMVSGTNFTTRGIFFNGSTNEPSHLWIPETPATGSEYLPLNRLPTRHEGADGTHVEIGAHFVQEGKHYELHVDSIRRLLPGETIHHPDFKLPNRKEVRLLDTKAVATLTNSTERALHDIRLPEVDVLQANLRDLVEYLNEQIKRQAKTPKERDIRIVLGQNVTLGAGDISVVTFQAKNVSVLEILIHLRAVANLERQVDGSTVTLVRRGTEKSGNPAKQ